MNHRPAAQADGAAVCRGQGALASSPARLCGSACRAGVTSSIKPPNWQPGHAPPSSPRRTKLRRARSRGGDCPYPQRCQATHREILASTRRWQCQQSNLWPVVESSSRRDWSPRSRPSPALLAWLLRRPAVWPRVTVTVDHQTLTVWRGGRWCG